MDIAIIGAGFCGLAIAWHLLHPVSAFPHLNVHLFDSKGIGGGASGIAAGLLHPYAGAHAKLNWRGEEGLQATLELLTAASQALGRPVTANNRGILRLALNQQQEADFRQCAARHPFQTEWLDSSACQALVPGCARAPGLWIKGGITVYSFSYLQGLWHACAKRGATLVKRKIHSLKELEYVDLIIVATGAETLQLPELASLPLKQVKGQILEFSWPENRAPLACPLNSHVYLLMTETGRSCLVGATYEKEYPHPFIDVKTAQREILPRAFELFPPLKEASLLNCYAGVRLAGPQHCPLLKHLSSSQWALIGMGSKGLLYHALYAKELVERTVNSL